MSEPLIGGDQPFFKFHRLEEKGSSQQAAVIFNGASATVQIHSKLTFDTDCSKVSTIKMQIKFTLFLLNAAACTAVRVSSL